MWCNSRTRALVLCGLIAAFIVVERGRKGSLAAAGRPNAPSATLTPSATLAPSGVRVGDFAFVSTRDGNAEIYLATRDAQVQRRLTNDAGTDSSPRLSPNGRQVVWSSNRDGNAEIYLCTLDAASTATPLLRLTRDSGPFAPSDTAPAWSPDGKTIAWVSTRGGGSNIWLMDATGANQRQLTRLAGVSELDWTPDGRRLAFFARAASGSTLDSVGASGGAVTRTALTSPDFLSHPTFNPAGDRIAFERTARGNGSAIRGNTISVFDFATGQTASPLGEQARRPSWSRSADVLLFEAPSGGAGTQIFAATSSGSARRQLTTLGDNFAPSF